MPLIGKFRRKFLFQCVLRTFTVCITGIAKTVADCFKYRNQIGLDVALEALREAWREECMTSDDRWRYAKVCRVVNVMRPYLDSLTCGMSVRNISAHPSAISCSTRLGPKNWTSICC